MNKTDGNDPAFPRSGNGCAPTLGMSIRDWFAGQALAGIIGATQRERLKPTGPGEAAHWAYSIADAMLAEREKK